MAAHPTAHVGLLLDDDDDAPVPIAAPASGDASPAPPAHPEPLLVHPADAPAQEVQRALAWATCPTPTLGLRAAIFYVSGLNLGISRRERDLRLQFCALHRAAWSTPPEPER